MDVLSRGDSGANKKRAAVKLDKLIRKEKAAKRKKVSQVNVKYLVLGFMVKIFIFTGIAVRQTD